MLLMIINVLSWMWHPVKSTNGMHIECPIIYVEAFDGSPRTSLHALVLSKYYAMDLRIKWYPCMLIWRLNSSFCLLEEQFSWSTACYCSNSLAPSFLWAPSLMALKTMQYLASLIISSIWLLLLILKCSCCISQSVCTCPSWSLV